MSDMNRREMLKAGGVGLALAAAAGTAAAEEKKVSIQFTNEQFYKDGKFNEEAAKDAVVALMKYHGYPIYEGIRDQLWIADYGTGQFAKLGLAAVMWNNNEKDRYMLMDIFHWHLSTDKNPAKREGWLVRYGLSHIVGEGEPNLCAEVKVPACHMKGEVTTKHEVAAKPGMFVPLNREGARHWQFAGPEGAIITEVANVHDNAGVRHSDQACNDWFLAPKK
jgi:D-lyxose ketol-isomerase